MPAAEARQALELKKLNLPPTIGVSRVEVEDYTDATGDDALRVLVVLDEDVEVDKVTGQEALKLTSAIHDSLQAHGIRLFPYIFFAKQSELDDTDED